MKEREIHPTGNCFDDAWDIVEVFFKVNPIAAQGLFIVHAICLLPDGRPYAHAWVEAFNQCLFLGYVEGRKSLIYGDKEGFYANYQVQQFTRYSVEVAVMMNERTNEAGPWEQQYIDLCGKDDDSLFLLGRKDDGKAFLQCKQCGKDSFDPESIKLHYCSHCRQFLDDPQRKAS